MSDRPHPGLRVGPDAEPDRYVLGPVVDSGSEGILYRGSRTTAGIDLDLAIKMLQPCFLSRVDDWHRRWDDQVQLLLSLQVPGVVGVRDGFLGPLPHAPGEAADNRTLYLVMNWVEGEPLHEWVRRRPERDPLEALKLLLGVASALDLIHSGQLTGGVPVVHCDVKPSNIVITAQGSVLIDFGLIRPLPDGPRWSLVTGTLGYVAPEVVEAGIYTVAADRYALGAVAYFVLTGTEPPVSHDPRAMRASLEAIPPWRVSPRRSTTSWPCSTKIRSAARRRWPTGSVSSGVPVSRTSSRPWPQKHRGATLPTLERTARPHRSPPDGCR